MKEFKSWLGFTLFCLAVASLTNFSVSNFPDTIETGTVLKQDIRADRRITVVNEEETKQDREKAAESVLAVFDFDESIPEGAPARLRGLLTRPIVASQNSLLSFKEKGIVLHRIHLPEGAKQEEQEIVVRDVAQILTVDEAKKRVYPSLRQWIVPNTNYNLKETEARKEAAVRGVKEKTILYQPGDTILRAGTTLEPQDAALLERVKKARGLENRPVKFLGTFLFVALAVGATFYFSERFIMRFLPTRRDYILMGSVIVIMLFLLRLSLVFSGALHESLFYNLPRTALYYAIPISGGVMLVRMFLKAEISLVLAVILSLLAGLTVGSDVNYTTYCLISSIAGSAAIARARQRTAIIKAGLLTGLANSAAILGILLIRTPEVEAVSQWIGIFSQLGFGFIGGIFSSILAFMMAPVFETVLDYTTDVKLMELANLNHPLLKELIVRAPGTYHHSHIVGILGEAAAEAIGANPLLAKVGAYFHDIGKMKNPSYFAENMSGKSRHEDLSPHMSALIVASHVKEGMAMAKEHRVPQKVIDMIPQHHGTKKIGFFFEKAFESTDPQIQQIEEKDFRYPGPKPQSKEAGILMLADSVEAATRALKEKSPMKIQKTVEEIIDKSFAEAQLDECDLTLKDLHEIGKAFIRILSALYHQRIDYAETKADTLASGKKGAASKDAPAGFASVHKLTIPKS